MNERVMVGCDDTMSDDKAKSIVESVYEEYGFLVIAHRHAGHRKGEIIEMYRRPDGNLYEFPQPFALIAPSTREEFERQQRRCAEIAGPGYIVNNSDEMVEFWRAMTD